MISKNQITKYLVTTIWAGILAVLFVPVVMHSKFFFPFIVPKDVLFRVVVEIIFIAYLALAHIDERYRPRFTALTWSVIAFFGVSVLAMITGIGLYSSFWGNYERMSGIFHQLHLVLYFIVLVNVFRAEKDWHGFLTFSIFMSGLMSFMAFAQYLQVDFLMGSSGGQRLTATMGNPTFFAAYLLFNLFFIAYFIAREQRFDIRLFATSFLVFDGYLILSAILYELAGTSDWGMLNILKTPVLKEAVRYPVFVSSFLLYQSAIGVAWFFHSKKFVIISLLIVTLAFEFFIFFETQTRGAVLGLLLSIIVLTVISLFTRMPKIYKGIAMAALALAIVLPATVYASRNMTWVKNNGTLNRLASISLRDVTTESRLLTWQASWKGWSENPKTFLIGYGPENYYYVFNKYFPTKIYRDNGSQIWFDRSHNIIFDVGVTTGAIGLVSYMAIIGLAVWGLWLVYRKTQSVSQSFLLVGLIIAYFTQNFFVFDTLNTEILWYLVLGFIVYLVGTATNEKESEASSEVHQTNYVYLSVLAIVLLFAVFVVNVGTARANNLLFIAIKDASAHSATESKTLFHRAINEAWTGRFEARQQYSLYAQGAVRGSSVSPAVLDVVRDAATELEKSVGEEPLNIRHHMWLAAYLDSMAPADAAFPKKSIAILEPNIDLSPTRPHIYFELGQAYALTGDIPKATEYFKKGVDLAPSVMDSHMSLLALYIVTKQFDAADVEYKAMLDLGWKPGAAEYRQIVDVYGKTEKLDRMRDYMELLVSVEPTAGNYARLAAIYAELGDKKSAREAVNKAVAIDPGITDEANKFLESLDAPKK